MRRGRAAGGAEPAGAGGADLAAADRAPWAWAALLLLLWLRLALSRYQCLPPAGRRIPLYLNLYPVCKGQRSSTVAMLSLRISAHRAGQYLTCGCLGGK